jgi:hypothetical protein
MITDDLADNTLRIAKITYVHPEGQKAEVLYLDNGDYGRDVQFVSPYAGTDFGFTSGIPSPEQEGHEPNTITDPDKRDIFVIIGMVQGRPYAIGSVYPQISQMAFTKGGDPGRLIERHVSDFYRTVDSDGNMDMVHPGGAFFRIGNGDSPDDLSQRDYDKRWQIKRNLDSTPTVALAGGDGGTAALKIDPEGAITIGNPQSSITLGSDGTITLSNSAASIVLDAGGTVTRTGSKVIDNTPDHQTTGVHTDANGVHV